MLMGSHLKVEKSGKRHRPTIVHKGQRKWNYSLVVYDGSKSWNRVEYSEAYGPMKRMEQSWGCRFHSEDARGIFDIIKGVCVMLECDLNAFVI